MNQATFKYLDSSFYSCMYVASPLGQSQNWKPGKSYHGVPMILVHVETRIFFGAQWTAASTVDSWIRDLDIEIQH